MVRCEGAGRLQGGLHANRGGGSILSLLMATRAQCSSQLFSLATIPFNLRCAFAKCQRAQAKIWKPNKPNPIEQVWKQAHLMPHIWCLISFPSFPLQVSSALFSSLFLYFFSHQSLHHFLHSHQNQDHFLNLHLKHKITHLVLKCETSVRPSAMAPTVTQCTKDALAFMKAWFLASNVSLS